MKKIMYCLGCLVLLMSVSCGSSDNADMVGKWQLVEYCYGTDCTMLADHDMMQVWELNADTSQEASAGLKFKGLQRQDSVMCDEIEWTVNDASDSLTIFNCANGMSETFLVSYHVADTMVLASMLNNKLVRQRFVRI